MGFSSKPSVDAQEALAMPQNSYTEAVSSLSSAFIRRSRDFSLWLIIFTLAWAPFPLGSNREWSWSVLVLLISLSYSFWLVWACANSNTVIANFKQCAIPICLSILVLGWAIAQSFSIVPDSWTHPIWKSTESLLSTKAPHAISLNPWRTLSEVTKLATYVLTAWLVFSLSRNIKRARLLLDLIIVIGTLYALYAFAISIIGVQQFEIFYGMTLPDASLSGPFVQRNSFATFEGLVAISSIVRLMEIGYRRLQSCRGFRRTLITFIHFVCSRGVFAVIATVLSLSALIATASRGASFATLASVFGMALPFSVVMKRDHKRGWEKVGVSLLILLMIMFWINGGILTSRLHNLVDIGGADDIRVALWSAARRMILSAPLLGLGLGSFQDAYPIYAERLYPFIMDKAHCDYLEFAAGVGLPAALCWWLAILWCAIRMLIGVFVRRKDTLFPLLGFGATVLVAVHSSVDFSLQIPAVALLYSILLGLGMSQAYPTKA